MYKIAPAIAAQTSKMPKLWFDAILNHMGIFRFSFTHLHIHNITRCAMKNLQFFQWRPCYAMHNNYAPNCKFSDSRNYKLQNALKFCSAWLYTNYILMIQWNMIGIQKNVFGKNPPRMSHFILPRAEIVYSDTQSTNDYSIYANNTHTCAHI